MFQEAITLLNVRLVKILHKEGIVALGNIMSYLEAVFPSGNTADSSVAYHTSRAILQQQLFLKLAQLLKDKVSLTI